MSLTQCKQCDEWCKGEFCSDECKKQWESRDMIL
jgi:hypothetical protein